jgi:hypothetical protein
LRKSIQRYTLNANQINLLKLLYKFRFITVSFLASFKGTSRVAAHKSLEVLLDQKYVGCRYDPSYKLLGKGAQYYLAPKGLKYLRDSFQLNEQVLHAMYKNKSVTEGFINHHVDTSTAYLHFRDNYPDMFHIFAKTELASFHSFPDPRPDLLLNRVNGSETKINDYFIELCHDTPPINARKRHSTLLEHYNEGDWEEDKYPALCFVLNDARSEEGFVRYAAETLDATGMDDEITILTTTIKPLIDKSSLKGIWSNVLTPGKLTDL